VPEDERVEVLQALESVDLVVTFGEDTPERVIREVAPDVLVKGGDWALDRIVGREFVGIARRPRRDDRGARGLEHDAHRRAHRHGEGRAGSLRGLRAPAAMRAARRRARACGDRASYYRVTSNLRVDE
jgi:hypothetical protein